MEKKKTSKLKTTAIGIAALAAIGFAVSPSEEPVEPQDPPAIEVEQEEIKQGKESADILEKTQKTKPEDTVKQNSVVDPEKAFKESLLQYKYVRSSQSNKYHKPTCRWTNEINESNLVHFESEEGASAAGYVPCGTCKP